MGMPMTLAGTSLETTVGCKAKSKNSNRPNYFKWCLAALGAANCAQQRPLRWRPSRHLHRVETNSHSPDTGQAS